VSPQTTKVIIAGVLLLHGLGHVGALAAIAVNWSDRGTTTGAWLPARSWLIPSLAPQTAKIVASTFWVLATIGFVAAALSFLGIVVPGAMWRQVALASSVVSLLGITLSFGTWPAFNTIAALGVNVAILVTQVWLHWPPLALFGK
jgi:hypothetical protein